MGLRTILTIDDPVLEKCSRPVENFDKRLHTLLDDMTETLRDAGGAGLAAVQVGVLRRVCVVEVEDNDLIELINPEIVSADGEQEGHEGCLSLPGKAGIVKRPMTVTVKACDRYGKTFTVTGEGLKARAFCHELDHLDGLMYTRLASKMLTKEEMELEQ